jgi:hypothetical protein
MQKIREQVGSAGLIVAIVALIAALAGGAYAASGSGGGKGPTASASAKQGPRGKQGKPGKPGAKGDKGDTGAAGANGQNGAPGKEGAAGKAGPTGPEGPAGKGVKVSGATLANCGGRGGAVIEKEEVGAPKIEACNGSTGPTGPTGPEGPALIPGSTLGSGETETGGWAFTGTVADTSGVFAAISFPVSLAGGLGEEEVHYVTAEEVALGTQPAGCAGGTMKTPTALPGHLCVYESALGEVVNATFAAILPLSNGENAGANKTGALLHFNVTGVAYGSGSWAVTGA